MKIILVDLNSLLVDEWRMQADANGLDNVEVHEGKFDWFGADAIVSPANSFGIMDGGVDLPLREFFGEDIQNRIRAEAVYKFGSPFVPVGGAVLVNTYSGPATGYKYLISAPTMVTPMAINTTINAYLATKAALLEAESKHLQSIVLMGMGAATGGYTKQQCALQMIEAIKDYQRPYKSRASNWEEVSTLYRRLGVQFA